MNIADYYSIEHQVLSFSRAQASQFAKQVAGDFNPIHNEDYKRFCVPGDLLFAVMLNQFGVASKTSVTFDGMVNDQTRIPLPRSVDLSYRLSDEQGRNYLGVSYSELPTLNPGFVAELTEQYVKFSGKTFPDILVGLMRDENAMIHPTRPLVIYKEMSLELSQLTGENINLELDDAQLIRNEKKGEVKLSFKIYCDGTAIGKGKKHLLLGGLRPFDEAAIVAVVKEYTAARTAYGES